MIEEMHIQETAPTMETIRSGRIVLVVALIALHGTLCWLSRQAGFLTGQDDVEYVSLGQSLRQFGYNEIWRVDAPVHSQYPPGYPAALAVWGLVFGDSYASFVALNALFSMIAMALMYVAFRRVFNEGIALAALAVLSVNPMLLKAGGMVGSEPAFIALSLGALAAAHGIPNGTRTMAAAITLAILAALTRSVGVVLIGALALHLLLGRRWKPLITLAVASALTVGLWLLWTATAPEQYVGVSYVADLRQVRGQSVVNPLPLRVLRRIAYYTTDAVPFSIAQPTIAGTLIDNIAGALIFWPATVLGVLMMFRRWRATALYLGLTAALLMAWPWRNERFTFPLLPLLVPSFFMGLYTIVRLASARAAKVAVVAAALILITSGSVRSTRQIRDAVACRGVDFKHDLRCVTVDQDGYFKALEFINREAEPDAVVLTAKSGALFHYTGRRSVNYLDAQAQGPDGLLPYLEQHNAGWIVLSSTTAESRRMVSLYRQNCARLSPEAQFKDGTVVFRLQPATDSAIVAACAKAITHHEKSRPADVPRRPW